MSRLYAGAALGVTLAFLGGLWAYVALNRAADPFAACKGGQVAGGDIGGPFTLLDVAGRTVSEAEVLSKPALVYFGYTFCPDICPFDMARNAEAVDILEERGFEVAPVFITIDPERDTPEALADYAANLHPKLIALTGTDEQIAGAAAAYRAYYKRQPAEDEFYLMDHSTFTYLMLPGHGFVDFFRREVTSDQMAEAVACVLDTAAAQG
jgi:protein SCO1